MTGVALDRRGVPTPSLGRQASAATAAGPRLWVELALFTALAGFALIQWARLVVDPPGLRLLAALAIVVAGAGVIGLATRRWPERFGRLFAVAVGVGATLAAMVVVGLPARLLAPTNWSELADNLSTGLAGMQQNDLPYNHADVWTRLAFLLGGPLGIGLAATVGFWPGRRRSAARVAALAIVVGLYGVAVTLDAPDSELLLGIVLLLVAAAWLWFPRLAPRRAAIATAAILAAGAVAVPAAARLDPGQPWWNYESWHWFSGEHTVTFDWDHSYGPLEWPQRGTELLQVRSTRPLYWKASVLDRFDGFTWQRAQADDVLAAAERYARRRTPGARLPDRHREWLTQASFEVTALESGVVIGTGTTQAVQGLNGVRISADGTLTREGAPLSRGDGYSVLSYSPQPTAEQLRAAPAHYPERKFRPSTLVGLPATVAPTFETDPSDDGPVSGGFAPGRPRAMPLWPQRADASLEAEMLASPYAETYLLARRLSAGARTPFDAVRSIEQQLRTGYNYSPNVPQHTYPLASFLFEDQAGYCQHYAGAMALMLRMIGIPSRVVSGFAPGSLNQEGEVYEIRDLDAHAWVEVYFRGIGWVTFDPTPAAAPAASQTVNSELGTFFRGRGAVADQGEGRIQSLEEGIGGGVVPESGADGDAGPWATVGLIAAALAGLGGAAAAVIFWRRRRALAAGGSVEAQLEELRRALERLGWPVSGETTLRSLERRFPGASRRALVSYVAALRAHRFAAAKPPPPGPAARRSMRRALSAGGGPGRRLRALLAIPPGGPAGS